MTMWALAVHHGGCSPGFCLALWLEWLPGLFCKLLLAELAQLLTVSNINAMRVHTTALLPHTIQMSCSQQQPSVSRHAHQNQKTTLRECFVSQLCLNDTCWACHDDSCTHGVHASLSVSYNVRSDNTTHLKCSCTLSGCRLCASPGNKSLYTTQVCGLRWV